MTPIGAEAARASAGPGARRALGLAWRLARRELRAGLRGFQVFLLCLVLGVGTIAAVGSLSRAMLGGLEENGRALLGGDVEVRLIHRPAAPEQLAWLENNSDRLTRGAEMRAMARAETPQQPRRLVELKAVDEAYPLYGAVISETAGDPLPLEERDGLWGALVQPSLLPRLGIEIGDRLRIGDLSYEVRGTILREPDRAAQAFTLGPRVLIHRESLAATGLEQPGSLISYHYRVALPLEESPAAWRARLEEAFPEAGGQVRDISNAAPGLDRFIIQVTLFMTLVGLTALLIGGLGIANAVQAYLSGKRSTIATLKCLGAPGRLIFAIYLMQIFVLALLGSFAGLMLGALVPFLTAPLLAAQLNFDFQPGLQPPSLLLAAIFGLLITFVFSLWPLARAQAVPAGKLFRGAVEDAAGSVSPWTKIILVISVLLLIALAVLGTGGGWVALAFVAGAMLALLLFRLAAAGVAALAGMLPRPRQPSLRLAVTNLYRPGATTGSIVTALGMGLTVLVAITLIEGNLRHQVTEQIPEKAPGFYFIDIQPDQTADFDALVAQQEGVEKSERVPMLRGRIRRINGLRPEEMALDPDIAWVFRGDRGITWAAEPPEGVRITAGHWWPPDYDGPPLVSMAAEIAQQIGVAPGDRLTVNLLGRDIEAEIANLRQVDWSELTINFIMIFSPGLIQEAPQTHLATVTLDADQEDSLERAVSDSFPNISVVRVKDALASLAEMLTNVASAVAATASVTVAAGLLVLAGAVAAGQQRRIYDAVILKVLGARQRDVLQAFLLEFSLVGAVASLLAVAFGTAAAWAVLTMLMRVDHFTFQVLPVAATAALTIGVTVIFGLGGTRKALRQKAAPLLRND